LVFGRDYGHTLFPGGNWPAKEDLDQVSPNNPVVIRRWMVIRVGQQPGAQTSGITKATKNPFGGEILRNATTGEPTGILTEAATGLIRLGGQRSIHPEQDILRALEHAARSLDRRAHFKRIGELETYRKLQPGQTHAPRLCLAAHEASTIHRQRHPARAGG